MLSDFLSLSWLIALPILGAFSLGLVRSGDEETTARNARAVALLVSSVTFVLSLLFWMSFQDALPGYQFEERSLWIPSWGISYHVGVDGLSLPFVVLTSFLTLISIVASGKSVTKRVREYMMAFLALEGLLIGMFVSLDLLLFYIFFEAVLIPMFLIIGIWGGARRIYASFKFFLYTLSGSLLMLIAVLSIIWEVGSTDLNALMPHTFDPEKQIWLWLAFFIAFAVKVPMWPVHTWLPDAHVEAPTAGSVMLAGVLLKMGGYGLIRFSLPLFPEASVFFAPFVFALSAIAIVYTSLVALAQEDMKKLIAYSSVAHMGFVTLGLFTFQLQGAQGAVMQMVSHGLVSAALFLCVGVIYDRLHTREISAYGGVAHVMPRYAFAFMVFMLASVGLPGTSGFVGEVLVLIAAFQVSPWLALIAGTSLVLGAAYMLWLYRRILFGEIVQESVKTLQDLTVRERWVLGPVLALILILGVFPNLLLKVTEGSVRQLIAPVEKTLVAAVSHDEMEGIHVG
ncbi:MAG: NADH-quinone oxidoreductase subunit M [bacterium]|nr:NADH-quinone oxidoreductase subunit M [bacterium]